MEREDVNRQHLNFAIWRATTPLPKGYLYFEQAVRFDILGVQKAIAALAREVGYEVPEYRPVPLNVPKERKRMAELREDIEGLKNGSR